MPPCSLLTKTGSKSLTASRSPGCSCAACRSVAPGAAAKPTGSGLPPGGLTCTAGSRRPLLFLADLSRHSRVSSSRSAATLSPDGSTRRYPSVPASAASRLRLCPSGLWPAGFCFALPRPLPALPVPAPRWRPPAASARASLAARASSSTSSGGGSATWGSTAFDPTALDSTAFDSTASDSTTLGSAPPDRTTFDSTAPDSTTLDSTAFGSTAFDSTTLDSTTLDSAALGSAGVVSTALTFESAAMESVAPDSSKLVAAGTLAGCWFLASLPCRACTSFRASQSPVTSAPSCMNTRNVAPFSSIVWKPCSSRKSTDSSHCPSVSRNSSSCRLRLKNPRLSGSAIILWSRHANVSSTAWSSI